MNLNNIMTFCKKRNIKVTDFLYETGVANTEVNNTATTNQRPLEPLITSIINTFKPYFEIIMLVVENIIDSEKNIIKHTGMDYSTAIKKSIDELRLELTEEKRNEFDNNIERSASALGRYFDGLTTNNNDIPYMAAALRKMSQSDIECWYNYGVINEETKAILMRIACKKSIDWNREPFINSFRCYVLENMLTMYDEKRLRY